MSETAVDLLVVGGGINGTGIARDAAGRGLSVMLVEKDDLASRTSSASSKLIHGGLRYLEQLEFSLVRESLAERERLLRAAPHIVRPLQFVIPLTRWSRPGWMLRAGLFLYDRLGGRHLLPGSRAVRLDGELGDGLKSSTGRGFAYWDCQVADSRLVVLNAMDAAERGATVLNRTELVAARRDGGLWRVTLRGPGGDQSVEARAIVNAAGASAAQLCENIAGARRLRLRLVKGSHIVVPRLHRGDHAFLLQNPDDRVVFAIPFEGFTLVGTTEVEWTGTGEPAISEEEIAYLLETIGRYFAARVRREDVIWSYAGIRALVDDGARDPSRVTRDYRLDLDAPPSGAPLLSIFGGKITTYRRLAEQALDRLGPLLGSAEPAWTSGAILPGGDIPDLDVGRFARELRGRHPALPAELLDRLSTTYGTRAEMLLEGVRATADLREHFGGTLHAREIDYLVAHEWPRTGEDVLFRRTKLGLHLSKGEAGRVAEYIGMRV